jgi:hypothetical protein
MALRWTTLCSITDHVPYHRIWGEETDTRTCRLCGEPNPVAPHVPARTPSSSRTVVVLDDSPARLGALSNETNNFPSLGGQEAQIHRNNSITTTQRENTVGRQNTGSIIHSRRPEGIASEKYHIEVQVIFAHYEKKLGRITWLVTESYAGTKERIPIINQRVNRIPNGDEI